MCGGTEPPHSARAGMAPPRPVLHRGANMAAPSEGRPGRGSAPFPGTDSGSFPFPFAVPHGAAGEPPKKPCRACTDFKSWLREQRKQTAPGGAVRRGFPAGREKSPGTPGDPQPLQSSLSPPSCPLKWDEAAYSLQGVKEPGTGFSSVGMGRGSPSSSRVRGALPLAPLRV